MNDLPSYAGAVWMRNGNIIYDSGATLRTVSASGGDSSELVLKDNPKQRLDGVGPALPDGTHFFYYTVLEHGCDTLWAASVDSRESRRVEDVTSLVLYSKGYLLSLGGNTVLAQPFDVKHLAISGEAVGLSQDMVSASASANGVLAYFSGSFNQQLEIVDRHGARIADIGDPVLHVGRMQLSSDGKQLATQFREGDKWDLWIYDLARKMRSRSTFDGNGSDAVWSPDGKMIIFRSIRAGKFGLYREPADGSSSAQLLYEDPAVPIYSMSWSPDGKYLLYLRGPTAANSLWVLPDPLGTPAKAPFVFAAGKFRIREGQFSPDGRWVAYFSSQSGQDEVYVSRFPGPGPKIQVSNAGGTYARWSHDGKELFYLNSSMKLISVPVTISGSQIEFGTPQPLFEGIRLSSPGFPYDVMPDGHHFVIDTSAGKYIDPALNIIQNWPAMLRKNN